jgi:hypothetical protein
VLPPGEQPLGEQPPGEQPLGEQPLGVGTVGVPAGRGPQRSPSRTPLKAVGVVTLAVACLVGGYVVGHGATSNNTTQLASSTSKHSAAKIRPAEAAMPAGSQRFALDMRHRFNLGSSITTGKLAAFGALLCSSRKAKVSFPDSVRLAENSMSHTPTGEAIQMTRLAEKDMCPQDLTAQTVRYVVTGTSGAKVTYGPAGTDNIGSVPMSISALLGTPSYYAVSAHLQGSGTVSCKIKVDGVVLSSATANGGYTIADCEIGQNPVTSSWEDDNSG